MTHDDLDHDLDRITERLPESLRRDWIVVPKRVVLQVAVVGLLLGASAALLVAGHVLDVPALKWTWPVVVGALMIATRFVGWWRGDRFVEQLRRTRDDAA